MAKLESSVLELARKVEEKFQEELDTAFEEGGTQERVLVEALFGLNGETPNAAGHVTLEDVAASYNKALSVFVQLENGVPSYEVKSLFPESQPDATGDSTFESESDQFVNDQFCDECNATLTQEEKKSILADEEEISLESVLGGLDENEDYDNGYAQGFNDAKELALTFIKFAAEAKKL